MRLCSCGTVMVLSDDGGYVYGCVFGWCLVNFGLDFGLGLLILMTFWVGVVNPILITPTSNPSNPNPYTKKGSVKFDRAMCSAHRVHTSKKKSKL
jgi:hypothetical protein